MLEIINRKTSFHCMNADSALKVGVYCSTVTLMMVLFNFEYSNLFKSSHALKAEFSQQATVKKMNKPGNIQEKSST